MKIIKNNTVGLNSEVFGASANEDFVFDINGMKVNVTNEPHIFSALKRLGTFPFKGNICWQGKETHVSDKDWE